MHRQDRPKTRRNRFEPAKNPLVHWVFLKARELKGGRDMQIRAVDAVMECLKAEGVDVVFGLPGGANLPTYDAFVNGGIRHILVRHEAGGGHAAEGYAKATGKVGVAFATSGPGATNLITPICDAMMDSVPVVFITGQVRTELLGTDGFQEADTIGVTMPVVKHSFMITDPREIPRAIHEAFHVARSGRPGPVLVDIPQDLSRAEIDYEPVTDVRLPGYQPRTEGNQKQIRQAAKALAAAQRPVIYAGGGVVNAEAAAELTEFATSDRFPVTCTLMGLGAFPAPHPQWLGMLGMHGTRAANYAMDEADLIVAIGARFDDRITGKLSEFAPRAKFIHVDVDPAEISKNVPAHIPIVGDAKHVLAKLVNEYRAMGADPERLSAWWQRIDGWKEKYPLAYEETSDNEIKPQFMIKALWEATNGEAIVTSDVGQHQMWTAQYYDFPQPRRWINSGGLGTMGFGLPAAMGAAVGCPDQLVCCVAGDGSVQMNAQELATCAQEQIPIKVFIMNNGYLGMVRQWQELFWDGKYSHVDMGEFPDFVKLAEAYGATGMRLEDKSTLVADMKRAIETPGPVFVDVRVTREENTYPMIPAGQAAREMVG
jgi:acetolactate synthase I/II/III large subunit